MGLNLVERIQDHVGFILKVSICLWDSYLLLCSEPRAGLIPHLQMHVAGPRVLNAVITNVITVNSQSDALLEVIVVANKAAIQFIHDAIRLGSFRPYYNILSKFFLGLLPCVLGNDLNGLKEESGERFNE